MARGVGQLHRGGALSTTAEIRRRIERGGERCWRVRDFADLPARTVARALARLAEAGVVQRVRNGLYYHPRQTVIGPSVPSPTAMLGLVAPAPLHPSGLSAANLLGLTMQNPARPELATPAAHPPSVLPEAKVHTRRPPSRARLSDREGAILELLRSRARYSDLPPRETIERLLGELGRDDTFARVARAGLDEPSRVRAMLGALGEQLGANPAGIRRLRRSLNPLSTFDFGVLAELPSARDWQAR
jgi:hypothetical protein